MSPAKNRRQLRKILSEEVNEAHFSLSEEKELTSQLLYWLANSKRLYN